MTCVKCALFFISTRPSWFEYVCFRIGILIGFIHCFNKHNSSIKNSSKFTGRHRSLVVLCLQVVIASHFFVKQMLKVKLQFSKWNVGCSSWTGAQITEMKSAVTPLHELSLVIITVSVLLCTMSVSFCIKLHCFILISTQSKSWFIFYNCDIVLGKCLGLRCYMGIAGLQFSHQTLLLGGQYDVIKWVLLWWFYYTRFRQACQSRPIQID